MSRETYEAMDAAIRAHFRAQRPHATMATDWVLAVSGISEEANSRPYSIVSSEGSSPWALEGLSSHLAREMAVLDDEGDD